MASMPATICRQIAPELRKSAFVAKERFYVSTIFIEGDHHAAMLTFFGNIRNITKVRILEELNAAPLKEFYPTFNITNDVIMTFKRCE